MDDDAAVRAALLEAREAGDITIGQYLNELKKLRQCFQVNFQEISRKFAIELPEMVSRNL